MSAFGGLVRAVDADQGIAVLTGAAGIGKTQLCLQLKSHFAGAFRTVVLTNSSFASFRALLQAVMFELDEPYLQLDEQELRLGLKAATRRTRQQERAVLLIADEAHLLGRDVLAEIRSLCSLVEDGESLIRVVLSGQPSLEETLAEPGLESFNQRIGCQVLLETLTRQESVEYVRKRVEIAGGEAAGLFSDDAMRLIAFAADGLPRCLNQLCDQSLLLAFAKNQPFVDESHVHEALDILKQMPLHWNIPPRQDTESSVDLFEEFEEDDLAATEAIETPTGDADFELSSFDSGPIAVEFGHEADPVSVIEVEEEAHDSDQYDSNEDLIDVSPDISHLEVAIDLEAIEEEIRHTTHAAEPAPLIFDGCSLIDFADEKSGLAEDATTPADCDTRPAAETVFAAESVEQPLWTYLADTNPRVTVEIIDEPCDTALETCLELSNGFDPPISAPADAAASFESQNEFESQLPPAEPKATQPQPIDRQPAITLSRPTYDRIEEINVLDRYAVLDSGRSISTFEEMRAQDLRESSARNSQAVGNEIDPKPEAIEADDSQTGELATDELEVNENQEVISEEHAIDPSTFETQLDETADDDDDELRSLEAELESGDWSGVVDVIDRIVPLVNDALETGDDDCDALLDSTDSAEPTDFAADSVDTSPLWYALHHGSEHTVHFENDATTQLEQWTLDDPQDEESQIGSAVLDACLEAKRAIGDRVTRENGPTEKPGDSRPTRDSRSRSIDRLFDSGIEGYVESIGKTPADEDAHVDDELEFDQSTDDYDVVLPEDEVELTDSRESAIRDAFAQATHGRTAVRTPKFSQLFTRLRRRNQDG